MSSDSENKVDSDVEISKISSGGNSKTPLENVFRARKFCFTAFNCDDLKISQISTFLHTNSVKFVFGKEICPTTGKEHLQGYMEFRNQRKVGFLQKVMCKDMRCFKAKGSRQQNWTYCTKDGTDIISNFETRDKPIEPYVFTLDKPYPWQRDIIDKCGEIADDRTINWFWDESGATGKTSIIKHIGTSKAFRGTAIQLPPKTADAQNEIVKFYEKNHTFPSICFIDIPRDKKDYVNYGGLETIKNMCFASGKYEGGQIIGPCPHLFVFANFPPDLSKWSRDRFVITHLNPLNMKNGHA